MAFSLWVQDTIMRGGSVLPPLSDQSAHQAKISFSMKRYCIFANDVKIKDADRFKAVPKEKIIQLTPHAVIADPTIVIKSIEGN